MREEEWIAFGRSQSSFLCKRAFVSTFLSQKTLFETVMLKWAFANQLKKCFEESKILKYKGLCV